MDATRGLDSSRSDGSDVLLTFRHSFGHGRFISYGKSCWSFVGPFTVPRTAMSRSLRYRSKLTVRNLVEKESPEDVRLFQTWRGPTWLRNEYKWTSESASDGPQGTPVSAAARFFLVQLRVLFILLRNLSMVLLGTRPTVLLGYVFRVLLASAVLSSSVLLWVGYFRLQENVATLAFAPLSAATNREVGPKSSERTSRSDREPTGASTKPDISIEAVDVQVLGLINTMFKNETLRVDLRLHRPVLSLRQNIGGADKYAWDLGLPVTDIDPKRRHQIISRFLMNDIVRPGKVYVRDGTLHLTPAGHADFGHGRLTQTVHGVNGVAGFDGMAIDMALDGSVRKNQGKIVASGSCDLNSIAEPDGLIVRANLTGTKVAGKAAAAILNLPFQVPEGSCNASLDLTFQRDLLIPHIRGYAFLQGGKLRFAADPKLNGRLNFQDHVLYFENPSAVCGTVPLIIDGSLNVLGDYNITASVRPIDVNALLDTFQVDKFFPIEGQVQAHLKMEGPLEYPTLSGTVETATTDNIVDKMPVRHGETNIFWDVNSGMFNFTDMQAQLAYGGTVEGKGTLSFDMTKLRSRPLFAPAKDAPPPEPEDIFKVDRHALQRDYETMLMKFKARNLPGSEIMRLYGGKQGLKALHTFGKIEGEAIVGGRTKDANVEAHWRTVGDSPVLFVQPSEGQSEEPTEGKEATGVALVNANDLIVSGSQSAIKPVPQPAVEPRVDRDMREQEVPVWRLGTGGPAQLQTLGAGHEKREREIGVRLQQTEDAPTGTPGPSTTSDAPPAAPGSSSTSESPQTASESSTTPEGPNTTEEVPPMSPGPSATSGPPPATSGPSKTSVGNTAMGRNKEDRTADETPQLKLQALPKPTGKLKDTRMHGTLEMKLGDPPEAKRLRARTFVDCLDGRRLAWDDERTREDVLRKVFDAQVSGEGYFEGTMDSEVLPPPIGPRGEVRYRQQQMKLKVIEGVVSVSGMRLNDLLFEGDLQGKYYLNEEKMQFDLQSSDGGTERIMLQSTTTGQSGFHIEWRDTHLKGSASEQAQSAFASSRSFPLHLLLGPSSPVEGYLDANMVLNYKTQRGNATIHLRDGRIADTGIDKLQGSVFWIKDFVSIDRCILKQCQSEYRVAAELKFPGGQLGNNPSWKVRVAIPGAELEEAVETLFGKSKQKAQESKELYSWALPDFALPKQLLWFENFSAEKEEQETRLKMAGEVLQTAEPIPGIRDVSGRISGILEMESDPDLRGRLEISGSNWRVGPHMIDTVSFAANAVDDVVSVENFEAIGGTTKILAKGQLGGGEHKDGLRGELDLKEVPSGLLLRHVNHRFKLDANVNAKVSLSGTAMEPEMMCDLDIKEGVVNDKTVKDLQGSFLYKDARAQANLSAQVLDPQGSRKRRRGGDRGEKFTFDASVPFLVSPLPTLHSARNQNISTALVKVVKPSSEIRLDMKIRRHGLLILNLIAPDMTWVGGQSDINLRVRGSAEQPDISGYGNVSDGKLWPSVLEDPLSRVRGEVFVDRGQVVSFRGFSGDYNGRSLTIGGELPLFDPDISTRSPLVIDTAQLMLNIREYFYGKAGGKISFSGSAAQPIVSGNVNLSEGIVFVQNFVPDSVEGNGEESKPGPVVPAIGLDNLGVKMEKKLSAVFPYVLNIGVEGAITLDGTADDPKVTGRVDVTEGTINLVTTKLTVKRGASNYAVFTGDTNPTVEFNLENNGLAMSVRQTRADKWATALEVFDKSSDNFLDERHWIGVISNRLRGIREVLQLEDMFPEFAARTFVNSYFIGGNIGDARWRVYPDFNEVLTTDGIVRIGEMGLAAEVEQNLTKLTFSAALNGISRGKVSFRPQKNFALNTELSPGGTSLQLEFNYEGDRRKF